MFQMDRRWMNFTLELTQNKLIIGIAPMRMNQFGDWHFWQADDISLFAAPCLASCFLSATETTHTNST
jgi:hypothetical protein